MQDIAFDRTDLRMLAYLQEHGRASNLELAQAVNLSASQCHRRHRRLEELGVITRYETRRVLPQVLECFSVTGDFDYVLKVVARDLKSLSQFLMDTLMGLPGVSNVRSSVCLDEIKSTGSLPLPA